MIQLTLSTRVPPINKHPFLIPAQNLNHPLCLALKFFCLLISSVSIFLSLLFCSVFLLLHLSWWSSGKAASCQKRGKGKQWKHSPSAGDIRGRKDEKNKRVISFHSGVRLTAADVLLVPGQGILCPRQAEPGVMGRLRAQPRPEQLRQSGSSYHCQTAGKQPSPPVCTTRNLKNRVLERREGEAFWEMTAPCGRGTSKLSACGKVVSSE